jgi:hypothetical protein
MIIVDWLGVSLSAILVQKLEPEENLIRHFVLNTLRSLNAKHRADYGQLIIAADSHSWRRDYFPHYKHKRRESRDKDKDYWVNLFAIIDTILDEIRESLPYPVLKVYGAEADDIMATLVESTTDFGCHEPVMIISSDNDFLQLQRHHHVEQWSPSQKKYLNEHNPHKYLREHILKGDSGDGVPNVLSNDTVFVEGVRQTPMTKKKLNEWLDVPEDKLSTVMPTNVLSNYYRNKVLIDLTQIPDKVKSDIMTVYASELESINSRKGKLLNYLIRKKCKLLIESANDF